MTGKEIITEWLREHEYDGLYNDFSECGCFLDDLIPCGEDPCDCEAGYEVTHGEERGIGPRRGRGNG